MERSPNARRTPLPDWSAAGSFVIMESSPRSKCVATHLPVLSNRPASCSARPAIGGPGVFGVNVDQDIIAREQVLIRADRHE
jgi:hypothetical protein